ncbi:MAG: extracellular solute-binding protein [Pseudomonadota bacterium]|nr:extracellular solute-binding protein [Pseudomonadota bacterium]
MPLLLLLLSACRVEFGPAAEIAPMNVGEKAEVWVYTSMYQHVLDAMDPIVAERLPGVTVRWFQSGSEKVAQRWEAEHEAGQSPACVVATSDPAWYVDLDTRGLLVPYVSPRAVTIDRAWVTPTWSTVRLSFMVLGAPPAGGPARFSDLAGPEWKDRFSSGDPLSSGTTFTTLAALDATYGWDFVQQLYTNGWMAAGGNSAVIARMESGERPVGIVLHENLLAKGLPATIPADGAVAVPGPVAIPTDCRAKDAAKQVIDWLYTDEAQALIVAGAMYSPFPELAPPTGGPPLAELPRFPTPPDFWTTTAAGAPALKERFRALVR